MKNMPSLVGMTDNSSDPGILNRVIKDNEKACRRASSTCICNTMMEGKLTWTKAQEFFLSTI